MFRSEVWFVHNFSPSPPPSSVFSLPNNRHGNRLMYKLVIGCILAGTILFTMNPVPQPSPAFHRFQYEKASEQLGGAWEQGYSSIGWLWHHWLPCMQKPNVLCSVVCLSDESYTAKSCYLGNMKECCSYLGWTISCAVDDNRYFVIGHTCAKHLHGSFVKTIHFCVINIYCLVLRSRWYVLCVHAS